MGHVCVFLLVPKAAVRAWVHQSFAALRRVEGQRSRKALAEGEEVGWRRRTLPLDFCGVQLQAASPS